MRSRTAALLVLLLPAACSAPPPPKPEPAVPPEEIFRRMERTLLESSSLLIRGRFVEIDPAATGAERWPLTLAVFLRGEGQCCFEMEGKDGQDRKVGAGLISDGTVISGYVGLTKPWSEHGVPPSMKKTLLTQVHRLGAGRTAMVMIALLNQGRSPDSAGLPAASDFQALPTKDGVASLSYVVKDLTGREYQATLWYDPGTLRPVRRLVGPRDGKGLSNEETYDQYVPDAVVPDARFVLPDNDPLSGRRWAIDKKHILYEERNADGIRFVLICDDGPTLESSSDGIQLTRGGSTKTIKAVQGMMCVKGNRTTMNALVPGWDNDLVQEYHEYRAAHPGTPILEWMKEKLKTQPSVQIQEYVK